MAGRIVVFGATGYTGRLVVAHLVGCGVRPVLAGRDPGRLAAVASPYGGLPTVVADAADPAAVAAAVEPGDVLVTTVGPFTRYGGAALHAAVSAGAHYVDVTGEAEFVRRVFADAGPRAAAAGVALLTAFGFDFVPGNLAGALAVDEAGPAATAVEVGYFATGPVTMSSGTRATGVLLAGQRAHALRSGRLVEVPYGRSVRTFPAGPGSGRPAVLFGGTEPLALPRYAPGLRDVATYLGGAGAASRGVQALSYVLPVVTALGPGRRVLDAVGERASRSTGRGPGEAERARTGCRVVAVARDDAGRALATVRLDGPNPYDVTAASVCGAARRLAAGEVAGTGALGPVEVFGAGDALAELGLRRVDGEGRGT